MYIVILIIPYEQHAYYVAILRTLLETCALGYIW